MPGAASVSRMGDDTRRAAREADAWIQAEDFVRWIGNRRPDQHAQRLGHAAFAAEDWIAFYVPDASEKRPDTVMRGFERWKKKWGYPSGFLARDLPPQVADVFKRMGPHLYVVSRAGLASQVAVSIARRDEMFAAMQAISGRPPRRHDFKRPYPRDTPTKETAAALGVPYRTLMFWITRDGAPHDKVKRTGRGGNPYTFLVNTEEIAGWVEAQKDSPRKKKLVERARVPVAEAEGELRRVMKELNVSAPTMAAKLGVSASTVRQILSPGSKARAKTVAITLLEKLSDLETEGVVYASSKAGTVGASITGPELQKVLNDHGGSMTAAAASLGFDRGAVERTAARYGLVWARATEPLKTWVTKEDLRQVFGRATSYKDGAVKLGTSVDALFKITKHYGMQDEALALMGKRKPRARVTRAEVEAALIEHGGYAPDAARALGYSEPYKLRSRIEAFGLEHLVLPPRAKEKPPLTKRQVELAVAKARREGTGVAGAAEASGRTLNTLKKHAEKHGILKKVLDLSKRGGKVPFEREELLALIERGDAEGWNVGQIAEASPVSRTVFFRRVKKYGVGPLLDPARARAKRTGRPPVITEQDVRGVLALAREQGLAAYVAAERAGFTGTGVEKAAARYGLQGEWRSIVRRNPPGDPTYLVRSPAQGLAVIRHPEITANYERSLRWKPKHRKAILVPCAGTKPFPDSPSHRSGYLKALEGKKADLFVVSEPLGVVPYSWSRRAPQNDYDYPPEYLRGEAHDLLAERIARWFDRVGSKYSEIVLALPGHHSRLVEKALDFLEADPAKITWAGIGDCLDAGVCPPGHYRATTNAYRGFLKARANPPVARNPPRVQAGDVLEVTRGHHAGSHGLVLEIDHRGWMVVRWSDGEPRDLHVEALAQGELEGSPPFLRVLPRAAGNPCGHRVARNPCPVCIGTAAMGAYAAWKARR